MEQEEANREQQARGAAWELVQTPDLAPMQMHCLMFTTCHAPGHCVHRQTYSLVRPPCTQLQRVVV